MPTGSGRRQRREAAVLAHPKTIDLLHLDRPGAARQTDRARCGKGSGSRASCRPVGAVGSRPGAGFLLLLDDRHARSCASRAAAVSPTSELNRVLQAVIAENICRPTGSRSPLPLRHAGARPHAPLPGVRKWAGKSDPTYLRYMESRFRERLRLPDCPVDILFLRRRVALTIALGWDAIFPELPESGMVLFNYSTRELTAKIVYYGPGLCGKTTNLQFIYENAARDRSTRARWSRWRPDRPHALLRLPAARAREIRACKTRIQLYTVPGQVFYNATRKLVLKGADGVVFVADSQAEMLEANVESLPEPRGEPARAWA